MKITTLMEDGKSQNASDKLIIEHGFSLLIEKDDKKILFDTGQTGAFVDNAKTMNIDLSDIDKVIISHGHYDHTGGFKRLVETVNSNFTFIANKKMFVDKYKCINDEMIFIGGDFYEKYLDEQGINKEFLDSDIEEIQKDVFLITNFKKITPFEKDSKIFYIKKDGEFSRDYFTEEVALVIREEKGLVLIVGCSHIGVCNIIANVKKHFDEDIYMLIGGTHLVAADEDRRKETIKYINEIGIQKIGVSHCTGEKAIEDMKKYFKDKFFYNGTGNIMVD